MLITYFVGDVPERGQGVALKFAYNPDLVATVKHSLREARVAAILCLENKSQKR